METLENANIQNPQKVSADSLVSDVIGIFKEKQIGALLVERNGDVAGLLSKDDIIQKVMGRRDPKTVTVAEVMTAPLRTIPIHSDIAEACIFACDHRLKYLIVTRDDAIAGILPAKELAPPELLKASLGTEDFFNRIGIYGDNLRKEGC